MDVKGLIELSGTSWGSRGRRFIENIHFLWKNSINKPIDVDRNALIMLARIAIHKTDGEDYMRARVRILVDDMIQRDLEATAYKYEYEPPDADSRRQAGTL